MFIVFVLLINLLHVLNTLSYLLSREFDWCKATRNWPDQKILFYLQKMLLSWGLVFCLIVYWMIICCESFKTHFIYEALKKVHFCFSVVMKCSPISTTYLEHFSSTPSLLKLTHCLLNLFTIFVHCNPTRQFF